MATSCNVRPLLKATPDNTCRDKAFEDFTLGPLMDALDRIEHDRLPVARVIEHMLNSRGTFGRNRPPAHPGLLAWTTEAVQNYLKARHQDQVERFSAGEPPTDPVRGLWTVRRKWQIPDSRGISAIEQTAWGRCYADAKGMHRDLWLLSIGSAKPGRPEAEIATAANVALHGHAVRRDVAYRTDWHTDPEKWHRQPASPATNVRLVDVGCTDGNFVTLRSFSRDEAERIYVDKAKPLLAGMISGSDLLPGASCVDCKALSGCAALQRVPGLLGIDPPARRQRRRSVSVSDLRPYGDCPAQYLLTRQLKLKSRQPESSAIRRGRFVDSWLNLRHQPGSSCCRTVIPAHEIKGHQQQHGYLDLADDAIDQAALMLGHHASVCPLPGLTAANQLLGQQLRTAYDPDLDLVILATPDLLYSRAGGWVWRETKTSHNGLFEGKPLMTQYPQLALAVLLLNADTTDAPANRCRIEFELLTPADVVLEELDPSRMQVVDEAREVIARLARPWMADTDFAPRPGRACSTCEAAPWCAPGRTHLENLAATEASHAQ